MLILVVVSFFILYAMTGLSQSIMVRDVENTVVSSVNELGRKVKEFPVPEMPNTQIAEHSLYNRGVQMAVYDKDGNIVFGYDPFGIVKSIDFVDDTLRVKKFNNKDYYFYDREVKIGEFTSYWVRGVACLTDETQSIQLAVKYNLLLIGLFVILAGLGGYVILGRALKPVSEIQMTAKEISQEIKTLTDEVKEKGVTKAYKAVMRIAELNDKYIADFGDVDPAWSPEPKQQQPTQTQAPAAAAPAYAYAEDAIQ